MISLYANVLVIAGILILIAGLFPVRRLISKLPLGPLRSRWYLMAALITLFIPGYFAYVFVFWQSHSKLLDLIVPVIFFFGACFVWLTTRLSLRTAMDMMRISLLEHDAATDPLTGVFNRRYLERFLSTEFASAKRYGLPLSVMMLDIDHFKRVNDKFGHQVGDQVLKILADQVSRELRGADILARYGGEEFLVIAPQTGLSNSTTLAERIRKRIQNHDFSIPLDEDGLDEMNVTVSIGVASIDDEVKDKEALILAADTNLLRAKRSGRNRVIAASSSS